MPTMPGLSAPSSRTWKNVRWFADFFSASKSQWKQKESNMLWTIGVILLILWLLGFLGGYAGGGLIHLLLVIAIVVVLIQVIRGRRLS